MSKRVKVGRTGSRAKAADVPARAFEEYQEALRRRETWAQEQATREALARATRQQGWRMGGDG